MQLLHVSQNQYFQQHEIINVISKQKNQTNRSIPNDPQERRRNRTGRKKIPIKSAKVRVHLLPQCHLTDRPEEKAGKQEQRGWGTLARPCLAQSSLHEFTNRADQGRHALVAHSHSSPVLTHQAPARVVLPIFQNKKQSETSMKQWKPRKGEFVHTQTYFNEGKGTGGLLSHHLNCPQKD